MSGSPSGKPVTGEQVHANQNRDESDEGTPTDGTDPVAQYPHGLELFSIVACLLCCAFLVALDRTIIATAVPKITDHFHSIDDIGWYASAFLITGCAFMLIFGKLYNLYPIKWVYLTCLTVFEIGSAICGAAPSSKALIIGRAIAGLGTAGMMNGSITIAVYCVPLHKRPLFQSMFGMVFGLASVVGPLLGGVLTDKVSWRWCFYINLPIGAATLVGLIVFLNVESKPLWRSMTPLEQLKYVDPLGTIVFLPGCTLLLLALSWGGAEFSWGSGRVVACLVLAGVFLAAFVVIQIIKGESATVPPRVIGQRSVAPAILYSLCNGGSMMTLSYYIPVWFQSIKGVSAVQSGIRTIALVLSLVVGSILAGGWTFRTGYYVPCLIAGTLIASVGAGLITTWNLDTPSSIWIGYQVIYGLGLGLGMQSPNLAVQTVLDKKDVTIGSSLIFFSQTLGGSVFVSVAQNVFSNHLKTYLMAIKGLNAGAVINAGATALRHVVPPTLLPAVLEAFNRALIKAFYVGLALSCATVVGALAMEWKSVKKGEGQGEEKAALEKGEKTEEPEALA